MGEPALRGLWYEAGFDQRVGPRGRAARRVGNRLQGETVEDPPHVFTGCLPDGQQHALALMVTRAILVGLTEVAKTDRPVDRTENLADSDFDGRAGKHVAAPDATLRSNETRTLQRQQNLLEIRLWNCRAFGDIAHRRRPLSRVVQREGQQRPARIVTLARNTHVLIVGRTGLLAVNAEWRWWPVR